MFKRSMVVAGAVIGVLVFAALPASAQQVGPGYAGPGTITATNPDGSGGCIPGGAVTMTVTNAAPGTDVTFIFESDPIVLGIATADADGVATLTTTWPVNASDGTHTISVQGVNIDGDPLVADPLGVDCNAAAAAAPLARTGSDSLPWLRIAMVLVTAGGVLVLAARKRASVVHERV